MKKKKPRGNNSTWLEQSKLEARRDQWLSHWSPRSSACDGEMQPLGVTMPKARRSLLELQMGRVGENDNGSSFNDVDSVISPNSSSSALGETDSGTNFTASYTYSISCSSSDWFPGNVMEVEGERVGEGDDDSCFDDWVAMADALKICENTKKDGSCDDSSNLGSQCSPTREHIGELDSGMGDFHSKQECVRVVPKTLASGPGKGWAWKRHDESQPEFLRNSVKQQSFPGAINRYGRRGGNSWNTVTSQVDEPSPCPICCEDMDSTDLSFFPCSCRYQLCLFCYKRILDEDCPCPNCRKPYKKVSVEAEVDMSGRSLTFRLASSYRKD